MLWLAWDLGEELTDRISPPLGTDESMARVRTNATLFELLPTAAGDPEELAELERSIRMTLTSTGEDAARAASWLARHLAVGRQVQNAAAEIDHQLDTEMRVGALVTVPGTRPLRRRVCAAVVGNEFSI